MAKTLDYWFFDDSNELVTDYQLKINICGFLINETHIFSSQRPARSDYMLIYIQSGGGFATINSVDTPVTEGDIIVFCPGSPLKYTFAKNTRHYYVHFSGASIAQFLIEAKINESGVYHIGHTDVFQIGITKMRIALLQHKPYFETYCNSIFLNILSNIAKKLTSEENITSNHPKSSILPAMKEMFENYNVDYPMEHYAELCSMSVSYFKHTFNAETSIPPHRYLTAIRMDHARTLLSRGEDNIKTISESVGYSDPFYFSRIFKKYFGFPPSNITKNREQ